MTKSRIAEWILSQVLPPDRAASTVGDWMEDVDKRGPVWFWSCVFRTAVSAIRSDFTESPGFMLILALRGWLFSWFLFAVTAAVLAPVIYLFVILPKPHLIAHTAFWAELLVSLAWNAWLGVLTGRWIARRTPGKEMAACIALVLISLAAPSPAHARADRSNVVQCAVFGISLLAGALWLRRPQRSVAQ
jgi:hypothetical protein